MASHVGYKSNKKVQLTATEHAVAGAITGVITRALIQPLDVLKIRFQLQVEPTSKRGGGLYHGVLQSTLKIVRTEGPSALWKGHVPAQFLTVAYGIGQFGSYAVLTKAVHQYTNGEKKLTAVCGGLAGVCGTLVSMPFDIVRTRLVAQGTPKVYAGVIDAGINIVRHEGVLSLWKGLLPTLAMAAPQTALVFSFYNSFIKLTSDIFGDNQGNLPWLSSSALSGTAAGVCSKVCVYPFDVLKKRLQIRGFEEARKQFGKVVIYPSPWSIILSITREEGLKAWLKGIWPSMVKAGVSTGLIFVTYEATCLVFAGFHQAKGEEVESDQKEQQE